jgi:NitT/TauT family transport system substrate-binding protein
VQSADENLSGPRYAPEKSKDFEPASEEQKLAEPIAVKPVTINFNSGQFELTENAKTIIDLQFADIAKSFANTRVRIEGNTDNVGGRQMNMNLSQKRAKAVADYLKSEYNISANRFIIVGNGPDKPVSGCEQNQNAACKAKNRRTEFQLIAG